VYVLKKGRSCYTFQFYSNPNVINQIINNYLTAENFRVYEKKGEQYFRAGDQFMGYRGLKYWINGQMLTIEAWLDGALGNFPLEQNSMNMMAMNYRNSLNVLFQEITKLDGGINMNNQYQNDVNNNQIPNQNINYNQMNNGAYVGQPVQTNQNQFVNNFQSETLKKQEKMCEIGFWLSLFGLLCSFVGVTYGVFVYIMNFYFASQGLKTRKKGKAKATIVLSIISILIIIFQLIGA